MRDLIIVNADDFGGSDLATARIAECFASSRITSTTAMVWMRGSRRAAAIAAALGIPVGLHLNLTQELDAPAVPIGVRERHTEVVSRLARGRRARMTFDVRAAGLVRRCIADQLQCFRDLYGREPTHLDGHNHVHLGPTVLMALPPGLPVRTAAHPRGRHTLAGDALRAVRRTLIGRRHPCCERFASVDALARSSDPETIRRLVDLAAGHTVELMAHPDREHTWRLLMSEQWARALEDRRTGSYADLRELEHRRFRPGVVGFTR